MARAIQDDNVTSLAINISKILDQRFCLFNYAIWYIFIEPLLQRSFVKKYTKALSKFVHRSHSAIRDWIQRYKPERLFFRKIKIAEFVVDETQIKVGAEYIWLWVAIESETKNIVATSISKERNMFVVPRDF